MENYVLEGVTKLIRITYQKPIFRLCLEPFKSPSYCTKYFFSVRITVRKFYQIFSSWSIPFKSPEKRSSEKRKCEIHLYFVHPQLRTPKVSDLYYSKSVS